MHAESLVPGDQPLDRLCSLKRNAVEHSRYPISAHPVRVCGVVIPIQFKFNSNIAMLGTGLTNVHFRLDSAELHRSLIIDPTCRRLQYNHNIKCLPSTTEP
jgi:hypothetical protein